MDFETNKKELFKMLQSAGREFGIRKASYSKLLKAGEITEEYFKEMCVELNKDWAIIRREVLLEWARTSSNCPFKTEELETIETFVHEPIRTIMLGGLN